MIKWTNLEWNNPTELYAGIFSLSPFFLLLIFFYGFFCNFYLSLFLIASSMSVDSKVTDYL